MSKFDNFTKEELTNIILNSKSFGEVAKQIGYAPNGNFSKNLRIVAEKLNIKIPFDKVIQKPEDYIGQVYGYSEVVSYYRKNDKTVFKCKCLNCHNPNLYDVPISNVKKVKSCGCLKTQRFQKGRYEDLTGQVFQHLQVLEPDVEKSAEVKRTYWKCLCLRCNKRIVSVQAYDLKNNRKDNCGCYNLKSKGEEKITNILIDMGVDFKTEYIFLDCCPNVKGHPSRFDFAIFENNKLKCLIEYQGKQHYFNTSWDGDEENLEARQQRDEIKKQYCIDNNIKLIEIPYWDFDLIDVNYIKNKLKE